MRRFICEAYPIDRLPQDLYPGLPSGRLVRVVIEDKITDDELRQELDAEIGKGLDDIAAGRVLSADEVLARIDARSGSRAAAAE